jgi:hypothetical protein
MLATSSKIDTPLNTYEAGGFDRRQKARLIKPGRILLHAELGVVLLDLLRLDVLNDSTSAGF